MITLDQSEVTAFNILAEKANMFQQGLTQVQEAQLSYIKLLELKYKAVYDEKTGRFNEVTGGV